MGKLETGIYIVFWHDILERVNKTSTKLQSCNSNLNTSIAVLKSVKLFIESWRESFDGYQTLGKEKSECEVYELKKKKKKTRSTTKCSIKPTRLR